MNPPHPETTIGPREAFLALYAENRRAPISNFFMAAVRNHGARNPREVVQCVRDNLYERLSWAHHYHDQAEEERILLYLDPVEGEPELALGFAEWAIAWVALPKEEREQIKQQRQDTHRSGWMGERPPSKKQLAYLKSLGYKGDPPATMLAASQLIEQMKNRRAA
jgi:hypothetical protein